MINVTQIDTNNKSQANRFIDIHYKLYETCPQWVPPFKNDVALMLNRQKHPFYEHSEADFFIATQDDVDVGRIAVMENKPYNIYHNVREANFYLFDAVNNQEIANALFERAFDWAKQRDLDTIVGQKGFGPLDGYGIQIEGFEHRQMMNMMVYNYEYYSHLIEALGFEKKVDFVSSYAGIDKFKFPERIHSIANRVEKRGNLQVKRFKDKKELLSWAGRIGQAYNKAFINNWEYYPLTEREISFVVDNILVIAHPKLIKIISHKDEIIGFLFGFHDISAAMQRINGNLFLPYNIINPIGIADLMLELRHTDWISFNGIGILPEFQGHGGNALMYSEMENTLREFPQFRHGELTQVAETAQTMRHDLENIGVKFYKNHRVYHKII